MCLSKDFYNSNINRLLKVFLLLALLSSSGTEKAFAQEKTDDDKYKNQKDIKDVIKDLFGTKKTISDTIKVTNNSKKLSLSILPGISYNPATDFVVGVSTGISWYMGDRSNTSNSSVFTAVSYTTKKQFKLSAQSGIYTENNEWNFQGDIRFWKYSQDTYGLGTGTPPEDKQFMNFKLVRINENVLKKLFKNFYAGLGYSLEYYFSVNTLDDDDKPVYPNYNSSYSIKHGFDSSKYLSSGLVLNTNFDSRDNTINPYKGIMADLKYYLYNKVLGSDKNRQTLNYEFRAYKSFSKESKYVLAFWTMGNFTLNGETPYLSLFSNGWDKFNTTGRAYIQGRFRGNDLLYAEIENRFSLTKNGLLGLVLFANAVSISNPDANIKLMDHIEPAAGFGLRIKFDKYSRTNICVDFGIGTHGSKTVFLNIGEIF